MNDDDLIRRGDAKAACQTVADEARSYRIPQMTMGANTCRDAINDLPTDFRTDLADALAAALRRIHDKRCEMDMGDLSADEAITEADDIARAALAAWEARK